MRSRDPRTIARAHWTSRKINKTHVLLLGEVGLDEFVSFPALVHDRLLTLVDECDHVVG